MKRSSFVLLIIILINFLISSCEDNNTVTIPTDHLNNKNYPIVTCSDFSTPSVTATEKVPLLVVRIQFAGDPYDSSFSGNPYDYTGFYSDACTWAKKIFYKDTEGELNHYFNAVSYNKFQLLPATETYDNNSGVSDGIITVTLSGNHPNPQSTGYFHQKLFDALSQANAYIDFSSYDSDNDGVIEKNELQVMFLVVGYESATTSSSAYPGVWAHKYCLGGSEGVYPPSLDGVTLMSCSGNGYSRFGERHTSAGYDATIGVIAHELGHAIWGLPDLYDTDGSSAGIGDFGLMGYGSWGREANEKAGETPVQPSAWVKTKVSWRTVDIASVTNTYNLKDTAQNDFNIIKVDISSDTNQYFLLENRAITSYDKGLYILKDIPINGTFAGGIAIWHIDEGQSGNSNENRKLVDLEEATNAGLDSKSHYGRSDNLYYSSNVSDFNNGTSPNSKDYSGATTNISISSVTARSASMNVNISF